MSEDVCRYCQYAYITGVVILCPAARLSMVTELEECPMEVEDDRSDESV